MQSYAMKTKRQLISATAAAALVLAPSGLIAAGQSWATSSPPSSNTPALGADPLNPSALQDPKPADINQFNGKITAVDKDSNMLTVDDKNLGPHKLHIDDSTKINKSGSEAAKFDELKIGDQVQGTCKKMSGDTFHAQTLTVSPGEED
jgi:hypothetical protein